MIDRYKQDWRCSVLIPLLLPQWQRGYRNREEGLSSRGRVPGSTTWQGGERIAGESGPHREDAQEKQQSRAGALLGSGSCKGPDSRAASCASWEDPRGVCVKQEGLPSSLS